MDCPLLTCQLLICGAVRLHVDSPQLPVSAELPGHSCLCVLSCSVMYTCHSSIWAFQCAAPRASCLNRFPTKPTVVGLGRDLPAHWAMLEHHQGCTLSWVVLLSITGTEHGEIATSPIGFPSAPHPTGRIHGCAITGRHCTHAGAPAALYWWATRFGMPAQAATASNYCLHCSAPKDNAWVASVPTYAAAFTHASALSAVSRAIASVKFSNNPQK